MQKIFRCVVLLALVAASASVAVAGELKLTIANGRATLIAQDVPLRQVLDEWARVGKTTIVNGDKLTGPPLTLQLVDRPEREVLDLILRSASGYIAAQRQVSLAGASQFDRVMILPVSRGPVGVASAAPTPFGRPGPNAQQMPMPMPVTDDDDPVEPPQIAPPGMGPQNVPGPAPFPMQPGQQPAPITAPRPGILPAPPPGQPNPYAAPGTPGGPVPPPFVRPGGPGGPGNDPDGAPGQDPDGPARRDRDDNPGNEPDRDPGSA
jgi:hypothetical protein